jgi:Glyoxalase/Bleomycin resistance protein/Dioxygenase superfamily
MTEAAAYHLGIVVPDIDAAMDSLSDAMGLSWADVTSHAFDLRTPAGLEQMQLAYTYSIEGPPFFELMRGPDDSTWSAANGPFVHHVGFWTPDLGSAASHLEAVGMPMEMTSAKSAGPSVFAYHDSGLGFMIELVDRARKPGLYAWLGRTT